ncbi:hypothetical protein LTR49_028028 [Elasticomyces elasticus]|nr:hypothetical protein LTR49_028028 [Elasticomyces elasticus]
MDKLLRLLPAPVDLPKVAQGNSADTLRIWDARTFVLEAEQRFQEYMNLYRFEELSTALHLVFKNENSIVEAWPMRLKLRHGEVGYQEEFDVLLGFKQLRPGAVYGMGKNFIIHILCTVPW